MLNDINTKIEDIKDVLFHKEKWGSRIAALEQQAQELEQRADLWREQLQEEQKDVERLTGITFSNLWHTLRGTKQDRLEAEEAELLEAKLKYDQTVYELEETGHELEKLREKWNEARYAEAEYRFLLAEKEQLIKKHYPNLAAELLELTEQKADAHVRLKEWEEALFEGRGALTALEQALTSLDSAKSWGTYDILGGGLLATKMKHDHMDDAIQLIHHAGRRLQRFQRELEDVKLYLPLHSLNLGETLRFADYLFDGFLADFAVQGRIKEALYTLEEQIRCIRDLVIMLADEARRCGSEIDRLERQYSSMIEIS